jgi:hypothetical protein
MRLSVYRTPHGFTNVSEAHAAGGGLILQCPTKRERAHIAAYICSDSDSDFRQLLVRKILRGVSAQ